MDVRKVKSAIIVISLIICGLFVAIAIVDVAAGQELPDNLKRAGSLGGYTWGANNPHAMIIHAWPEYPLTTGGQQVNDEKTSKRYATALGETLYGMISGIRGVQQVGMEEFRIVLTKWPLFTQETIEAEVIGAITKTMKEVEDGKQSEAKNK